MWNIAKCHMNYLYLLSCKKLTNRHICIHDRLTVPTLVLPSHGPHNQSQAFSVQSTPWLLLVSANEITHDMLVNKQTAYHLLKI